jgi:hypothetical protein
MYKDTDAIRSQLAELETSLNGESACMYDPTESYRVGYIQGQIDILSDLLEESEA